MSIICINGITLFTTSNLWGKWQTNQLIMKREVRKLKSYMKLSWEWTIHHIVHWPPVCTDEIWTSVLKSFEWSFHVFDFIASRPYRVYEPKVHDNTNLQVRTNFWGSVCWVSKHFLDFCLQLVNGNVWNLDLDIWASLAVMLLFSKTNTCFEALYF